MRKLSPQAAHALAAEYVLGTLRGAARRRFEAMARADAELAAIVRRWEQEMTPLAEVIPPVEPPAQVWQRIEARLGVAPARPRPPSIWESLAFWRTLGAMATGMAVMLLSFFLYISTGPRGEPVFVAVLEEDGGPVRTVVSMHSPDLLRVRMVKPWTDTRGGSLELWVLPKEGAPRWITTVPNQPGDTMVEIRASDPRVQGAQALAISLEPLDGARGSQPQGPVVAKGVIAPVKRT